MKSRLLFSVALMAAGLRLAAAPAAEPAPGLRQQTLDGLKKAVRFYTEKISSHGGYAYYYGTDLKQAWGEGVATKDQIWTEPPGTPAVGIAFLQAYEATGDNDYLLAALNAGMALVYGQLQSGGWSQTIDFDPQGTRLNQYRNGRGTGLNHSSLDDNQTQSCIQFLARLDAALNFKNPVVHEAVEYALDSLLKAQFPNGAFPQGWSAPVERHPVLKANYYPGDWPRLWPQEQYHVYYTLNDSIPDTMADTLMAVYEIYGDKRYLDALRKLGDFLILAQMPDPQPAWCQQYNFEMRPTWARKFEPPAISGLESEDTIKALMKIYQMTGDKKYLEPLPRALAYLRANVLPDGRMPRFFELKTNKPIYMTRAPGVGGNSRDPRPYDYTDDPSKSPKHYGWIQPTEINELIAEYDRLKKEPAPASWAPRSSPNGKLESLKAVPPPAPGTKEFAALEKQVRKILGALDEQGRWVDVVETGTRLVGQPNFQRGFRYIGGDTFNWNVQTLSDYLLATRKEGKQGGCK